MRTRVVLLVAIALCLPELVHAQFKFGAAAEFDRFSFGGVPPEDAEYHANYGFGVSGIFEYRVHKDVVLSFQPGWLQKGAEIVFNQDEDPDLVETFVVEQSWVTLPVYFRIDSDGQGFYAGGGLSADFLLKSELEHDGTTTDNQSVFEDVDATYQFTMGYMYPSASQSAFFAEARYVQGLAVVGNTDQSTVGDIYVAPFKSTGLRLVAGILF